MFNAYVHVVGSLLRPKELLKAREQYSKGSLSSAEFKRIEDRAVDQAITVQEKANVDIITDGEQRRTVFMDSVACAIDGIKEVDANAIQSDNEGSGASFWHGEKHKDYVESGSMPPSVIADKLVLRHSIVTEEYAYARARAKKPVKVTLTSPLCMLGYWSEEHSRPVYPGGAMDTVLDLAEIIRCEIEELASLGCEHVQIDAPELTVFVDPKTTEFYSKLTGISREDFLSQGVDFINRVATVPGVTYSIHLCRGNNQGLWHSQGGYGAISREVFPRLSNYQYLLLEFDDERSGSFEPIADANDDMTVVLGLISTKHEDMEDPEKLKQQIKEAGRAK